MPVHLLVFAAALLFLTPLTAADLVREQQIAAQVEAAVSVGVPQRLQVGDIDFLAIHAAARNARTRGAVILLHDRGMHPDWLRVVHPLRSRLPDHGWETLSLQMPLASPDAPDWTDLLLIPESAPRIAAGMGFLRQRGIDTIVLLGHGLGARMAIAYLQGGNAAEVRALVAVGFAVQRADSGDTALAALRELSVPLLDIYGSRDSDPVLSSAQIRAEAGRSKGYGHYRQDEVTGADHFFNGLDGVLVARVRSWLARYAGE